MVKNKLYDYLIFFGICTLLVIAPLVRGAKPLWVMTIIEIEIFSLVFIWLWKINNNRSKYYLTKGDSHARATEKGLIKRKFIRTPIDLPLWLFVFLGVFSCSMSIYLYASMLAMFRLFAVVGLYYLVVNNLSKKFISYIVVLLITMGVALSLIGFAQLFCDLKHEWWYPRAFMASTFINHNHFSGYLELIIPLTIGVFVMKRRDSSHRYVNDRALFFLRCILALSLLVMVCAFVIAQSRGAWVCLTVSILIMNIILVRRRFLKKISFLIFVFIVAVGVLFILGDNDTLSQRMESLSKVEEEGTFNVRLEIWKGTVEIIKDNIWKGTGIGTFAWSFAQYRPIKVLGKRAFYSHNDYLHMTAEMGIVALPLMIWMIITVIVRGMHASGIAFYHKDRRPRQSSQRKMFFQREGILLGSAIGILSLALHGLVDFNFHIPANMNVVAVLAGIIMRND